MDLEMKSYYEIIGLTEDDTPKEIKIAFRKLAIKNHPDVNPNNEMGVSEKLRKSMKPIRS